MALTFGTLLSSQGADAHRCNPFGLTSGQPVKHYLVGFALSKPTRSVSGSGRAHQGTTQNLLDSHLVADAVKPARRAWRMFSRPCPRSSVESLSAAVPPNK